VARKTLPRRDKCRHCTLSCCMTIPVLAAHFRACGSLDRRPRYLDSFMQLAISPQFVFAGPTTSLSEMCSGRPQGFSDGWGFIDPNKTIRYVFHTIFRQASILFEGCGLSNWLSSRGPVRKKFGVYPGKMGFLFEPTKDEWVFLPLSSTTWASYFRGRFAPACPFPSGGWGVIDLTGKSRLCRRSSSRFGELLRRRSFGLRSDGHGGYYNRPRFGNKINWPASGRRIGS